MLHDQMHQRTSQRRASDDNDSSEEGDENNLTENKMPGRRSYHSRKFLFFLLAVIFIITGLVVVGIIIALTVTLGERTSNEDLPSDPMQRAKALLRRYPVIDGHNDLALEVRFRFQNQFGDFDLQESTSEYGWHTDIPRLKQGEVGAQFWSAYMGCSTQYRDATRTFIDQMDVIKRIVEKYNGTFELALSAEDIERANYQDNKIASLIGVEGGHAIDSSLGTLRAFYELGGRYMTLTHTCDTPWADSANGEEPHSGLNEFGKRVVREMNRLGMMVDISHVSAEVMRQVLDHSLAPVIFSHSSVYSLCDHVRNVPDDVLRRMPDNGGIVMINFFPLFINCSMSATLEQVADHIDYVKEIIGVDYIGIGSDFDGIPTVPEGLEDVSKYPALFAELIRRSYTDEEVAKIAHTNLIRVFKQVESVRDQLRDRSPDDTLISPQPNETCRPDF